MVYFDDILIYSKNLDDHLQHIRFILKVLRKEQLYVVAKKWIFCIDMLMFLGFMVSAQGVEVYEE